jgi:hypothetical protein
MKLLLYLLAVVLYIAVVGVILFLSAGRADQPLFWAYLIVLAVTATALI